MILIKNIILVLEQMLNTNETIYNFNNEILEVVDTNTDSKIILTLGFYFGGNTRAPHKMHINYTK